MNVVFFIIISLMKTHAVGTHMIIRESETNLKQFKEARMPKQQQQKKKKQKQTNKKNLRFTMFKMWFIGPNQ